MRRLGASLPEVGNDRNSATPQSGRGRGGEIDVPERIEKRRAIYLQPAERPRLGPSPHQCDDFIRDPRIGGGADGELEMSAFVD
jgi:hypothetical protein